MARPWPKRSAWPYVAKSGRRSYVVGFYDHDKRERSRTFPSVRHARAWMDDYITAERRGRDSLRRFLLDLDAKEANEAEGAHDRARSSSCISPLNAHPRNEEGVAPSTYALYESALDLYLLGKPRHQAGDRRSAPATTPSRSPETSLRCLQRAARAACVARADAEAGVPAQTRDARVGVSSGPR